MFGLTRYQWLVLFAAWLGWGFDVFDGLLFNFVAPICVPNLLHLLWRLPPAERPDSLVVGDDNLLPPALATLAGLGVQPGRGFQVVAHANFPVAMAPVPGVRRIGFSIPQVVGRALDCMAARIAGGDDAIPPSPAYLDDEVDAAGMPLDGSAPG